MSVALLVLVAFVCGVVASWMLGSALRGRPRKVLPMPGTEWVIDGGLRVLIVDLSGDSVTYDSALPAGLVKTNDKSSRWQHTVRLAAFLRHAEPVVPVSSSPESKHGRPPTPEA